jgi:hypothetical protein
MSSESEIVNVLSSIANIFLKAVDALEGRLMMIEQRVDDLERFLADVRQSGAPSPGSREQTAPSQAFPPMAQDTRRAPTPMTPPTMNIPPPQPPQRVDAYSNPQPQYGSPRQDTYSQPQTPSYQSRPPTYQPPQQQPYPPPGQPQPSPYGAPSQSPQAPAGPRPPTNPLNMRQALTSEIKDVFAKMRARAEGR